MLKVSSSRNKARRAPVAFYALEIVDNGNAEASDGVEDGEHHHIQREMPKQRLQANVDASVAMTSPTAGTVQWL